MFKKYYLFKAEGESFFVEAEDFQEAEIILKFNDISIESVDYAGCFSDVYAKASGLIIY